MLFRAKIALRSVCDITPQLLEKLGVCGLLLDIDNTLTTHDNPVPAAGVEAWVAGMQAAGISLCLVSNNHPPRVEPFAKRLGLDFVCEGKKPLTKGYREAVQKMGLSRKEVAAVGDQIFTDVLGANRLVQEAFEQDVTGLMQEVRVELGGSADPMGAYLASGHETAKLGRGYGQGWN